MLSIALYTYWIKNPPPQDNDLRTGAVLIDWLLPHVTVMRERADPFKISAAMMISADLTPYGEITLRALDDDNAWASAPTLG